MKYLIITDTHIGATNSNQRIMNAHSDMMANLTLKQVEDYVGKDIAEKIQNEEGNSIVTGKQIGRAHV